MTPEIANSLNKAFGLGYPVRVRVDSLGQPTVIFLVEEQDIDLEAATGFQGTYDPTYTTYTVGLPF